jgi:hypothetical protein
LAYPAYFLSKGCRVDDLAAHGRFVGSACAKKLIGFAKPEEFQIESILSGPERAQNGHCGVIFNALGWRELAGLNSPTRTDKPRHEVSVAVVFSESVCFERPESTTTIQGRLFSVGLFNFWLSPMHAGFRPVLRAPGIRHCR